MSENNEKELADFETAAVTKMEERFAGADIQQEFRTAVRDKYKFIFRSDAARTS